MANQTRMDAGETSRELTEVPERMQTIQARLVLVITPELDAAETAAALRTS